MYSVLPKLAQSALLLFLIIAPTAAMSEEKPLPAEAQSAFDQGMSAAQKEDWKLAITSFLTAEQAAPQAPQVLFNLGLASSKLPANEFRTIAWFKAYLLASPDAANAEDVRKTLTQLESSYEQRMTTIVNVLEKVSRSGMDEAIKEMNALPQDDYSTPAHDIAYSPADIGGLFAAMHLYLGDTEGAKRSLESFGVNPIEQCRNQEKYMPEYFEMAAKVSGLKIHKCETRGHPVEMKNEAGTGSGADSEDAKLEEDAKLDKVWTPEMMYTPAFIKHIAAGGLSTDADNPRSGWTHEKAYTPEWLKKQAAMLNLWKKQYNNDVAKKERDKYNVSELISIARNGQAINVNKFEEQGISETAHYEDHKFDDTQMDDFVSAIQKDLQTFDELNPHATNASDFDPNLSAERGDALANWMNSLTSLVASYRRMRGS